ncbi:MAG TPA: ammonium transporter, partial [Myxococcota bacterium]|nr:ammonium transporter [Myxococcota bacterium]
MLARLEPLRRRCAGLLALGASFAVPLLLAGAARAEDAAPTADPGHTAWVIAATGLVLMMTLPGLALFYGGLVRSKNVLNVFMQCFVGAGVVGVLWVLVGYSLAFSGSELIPGFVGDFSKAGLAGITKATTWQIIPDVGASPEFIPELIFVMFQCMFAIITPALILGAVAERMKFSAYVAFISLWLLFVYCPLAYMVWNANGWIFKAGGLDFAGGLVVHMSSGFSALALSIVLGKRTGFGKEPMPPHSVPLCMIGAGLLWAGWFGFNAGSALGANGLAASAFLNTNTATCAAVVTWALIELLHRGKATAVGAATSAVAGLVAITPACGHVTVLGALVIGAGVSLISYTAVVFLKSALGYDDSLDVFGVHGLGGLWGAVATGLFGSALVAEPPSMGAQLVLQLKGVAFAAVFAVAMTAIIALVLKAVMGLRVGIEDEDLGLDLAEHSETAYSFGTGAASFVERAPEGYG